MPKKAPRTHTLLELSLLQHDNGNLDYVFLGDPQHTIVVEALNRFIDEQILIPALNGQPLKTTSEEDSAFRH